MCCVDSSLHAHKIYFDVSVVVGGGANYVVKIKQSLPTLESHLFSPNQINVPNKLKAIFS